MPIKESYIYIYIYIYITVTDMMIEINGENFWNKQNEKKKSFEIDSLLFIITKKIIFFTSIIKNF